MEVDSNVYEESLRGGDDVVGTWVEHGDRGRVWLVGLGPCVLTVSHTAQHMIDVTTRSCYGDIRKHPSSNDTASNETTTTKRNNVVVPENPKISVGYIAACAVDADTLVVHIAYKGT